MIDVSDLIEQIDATAGDESESQEDCITAYEEIAAHCEFAAQAIREDMDSKEEKDDD